MSKPKYNKHFQDKMNSNGPPRLVEPEELTEEQKRTMERLGPAIIIYPDKKRGKKKP